jgi:CheY-like chemotaxis protein
MDELKQILLVEDCNEDIELTLSALEAHLPASKLIVARDGEEALDYLYRRGAFAGRPPGSPVLVLLDLKMPKVDGLEVLRQMKSDPNLKTIPVVMLTSSREEQDLIRSYSLGANAYVVKPVSFEQFSDALRGLGSFWAIINEPPPGSAGMETT